jgi:hypothetical protein
MGLLPLGHWGAPGGWEPSRLTGLAFWAAADRETGYQNNDPVGTWHDRSGNGRDATAAGAARPTYKTNVVGGRPGLLYAQSAGSRLDTPAVGIATFTIALVVKLTTDAGILIEQSPGHPNSGFYLFGDVGDTLHVEKSGTISDKEYTSTWAYGTNALKLVTWEFDGTHAGHTLRVDRAAVSLTNGGATNDPGTGTATDALHIGGRLGGSLSCTGYFFEAVVCTPQLSAADRTLLEQYLHDRWGTP